ncbi:MAG: hypothetical protein J5518_11365 [Lachnospiraceae bacterium]|nr:hypothetical protein [Lachnospiraceae bacterium]
MYYVPDDTKKAGYYECLACHERFLDVRIAPRLVCPYCGVEPDMELGPDDEMPDVKEDAFLIETVEGEDVERYDTLLSLAITGGDYLWI